MSQTNNASSDDRLNEILAEYLQAAEAGESPDEEKLLEQYPEYATQLREFFADKRQIDEIAKPDVEEEAGPAQPAESAMEMPTIAPNQPTEPGAEDATLPPGPRGGDVTNEASAQIGEVVRYFGDYELLEEIARGGMGVVYKARQINLNRTVALKMILAGQLASEDDVKRFYTEAEAAANLDHPGIVPIFEVGEHEGQHYFSMGFVEGESLADRLKDGPLPPREAAEYTKKIAEAIAFAHERGVIHRDLKPANVLLEESPESRVKSQEQGTTKTAASSSGSRLSTLDTRPRVTDFGLAKKTEGDSNLTGTGQILGTPSYMPPEQASGKVDEVAETADIYSLGAILYALVTARPPFQADNPLDTLMQVLEREPISPRTLNPNVPQDLETICLKCLEKDRQRRYSSAQDLADELQRFADGKPILARPISAPARYWRWCKRKPVLATAAATAIFSTVAALIILLIAVVVVTRSRNEAVRLANDNARLADEKQKLAEKEQAARVTAEDQLRTSNALRLATESRAVRAEFPERGALLAIEAAQATLRYNKPIVPAAHETLFESLDTIGGRPLVGHTSDVTGFAISPDSRWLASVGRDKTTRLWDLHASDPSASSKILRDQISRSIGNDWRNRAVVFSADGRWLADGFRLWNLQNPAAKSKPLFAEDRQKTLAVALSPDGRWGVARGQYGTTRLWDLQAIDAEPLTSEDLAKYSKRLHKTVGKSVDSLVLSSDGRWLAIGGFGGALYDLKTADPALSVKWLWAQDEKQYRYLGAFTFSPNCRWLIAGSYTLAEDYRTPSDYAIRLWDLDAEEPFSTVSMSDGTELTVCRQSKMLRGHTGMVNGLAITPDSRWLVTGSADSTVRIWDLQAAAPADSVKVLRGHEGGIQSVAISPDGRWLTTGGVDKTVRIWDLESADPGTDPKVLRGHEDAVWQLAISPDGRWLVTPSGNLLRLWDLQMTDPATGGRLLKGLTRTIRRMTVSADGRWLVTVSQDKTAQLWDLQAADPTATSQVFLGHEGDVSELAISPDGRWLVTSDNHPEKTRTLLWDLQAADPTSSPRELQGHYRDLSGVAISPNGRWLATRCRVYMSIRLWNLQADDPAASSTLVNRCPSYGPLVISSDSRWLATATGYDVAVVDLQAAEVATSIRVLKGHQGPIQGIAIGPESRWLVSSSSRDVRVWDLEASDPAASVKVLQGREAGTGSGFAMSPDGRWLVTKGYAKTEQGGSSTPKTLKTLLWDLEAADPAAGTKVLANVDPLAISPDSRWLITGGEGNRPATLLWDLQASDPSATARVIPFGGMFSPDGRWALSFSVDGTVRRWEMDVKRLMASIRTIVGRELTPEERQIYSVDTGGSPSDFLAPNAPTAPVEGSGAIAEPLRKKPIDDQSPSPNEQAAAVSPGKAAPSSSLGKPDQTDTSVPDDDLKTVPRLLAPAEGAVLGNGSARWEFKWSEVEGATGYDLYVAGHAAEHPLISETIDEPSYHYQRGGYIIERNRKGWTWKVRAIVDGQPLPWSKPRTFDVAPLGSR